MASILKTEYQKYLFNCHCQGDIWNSENIPFTFKEWIENGQPSDGGKKTTEN